MHDLIILGSGVHGLEMAEIIERVNAVRPQWNLRGYLVPAAQAQLVGQTRHRYPVLGTSADLAQHPGARFVADNEFQDALDLPADRWISLVDPSTFVAPTASLGPGCVVYPHGFIGHNARLGKRVFCLSGCCINHDDVLEDGVVVTSGVTLAGGVHVEANCYLGQACTVRQYLRIGCGSLIGMGAVVVANVPPNSVMVGNPARKLKNRNSGE